MDGSRLFGGKFPINLSRPLVRSTAFKPLSPITSWAETSAWRTSELTITASSRLSMLPPYGEYGENGKGLNGSGCGNFERVHGIFLACAKKSHALIKIEGNPVVALGID